MQDKFQNVHYGKAYNTVTVPTQGSLANVENLKGYRKMQCQQPQIKRKNNYNSIIPPSHDVVMGL
jgi:hypothetical protein